MGKIGMGMAIYGIERTGSNRTESDKDQAKRRKKARPEDLFEDDGYGEDQRFVERRSPSLSTEQTERLRIVRQAVGSLPTDLRQVVVMKEFEDMTFQEISETLELPLSTVKSRLYTALKQLKMKLERLPIEIV